MLPFHQYYILTENPDYCKQKTFTTSDAITIGIISNLGFGLPQQTHKDMYNQIYLLSHSSEYRVFPKSNLIISGDFLKYKNEITEKIKFFPWALINNDYRDKNTEAGELLRSEFFDVCGRIWKKTKTVSFWNTLFETQKFSKQLTDLFKILNLNIEDFEFEFIDLERKFLSYWDFIGVPAAPTTDTKNKLLRLQHTIPEVKKALHSKDVNYSNKIGDNIPAAFFNKLKTGD